jgi:hypothetical protein
MVKICYVDEAGCTGTLDSPTSSIQPTLVIVGLIIDYSSLHKATAELINAKKHFFPKLLPAAATHLDWIREEVKGSDVRKQICSSSRNERRHGFGFLDTITKICTDAQASVVGRVWVKEVAVSVKGTAIYTSSIQSVYGDFQRYLTSHNDVGFVVADSRLKHLNTQVAHSIFTQKFKGSGDNYDRIIELPAFSHSDNHAGLQVADLICSAFVAPIAITTFCEGTLASVHIRPNYSLIKTRYCGWLKDLQFRYIEASGRSRGGLTVADGLNKKPGGEMFR